MLIFDMQINPILQIITGAVDSHLNADKYIVPGLGDYGDRFGYRSEFIF